LIAGLRRISENVIMKAPPLKGCEICRMKIRQKQYNTKRKKLHDF
jgi:hypothetical protein